jgi:hypothetical protein
VAEFLGTAFGSFVGSFRDCSSAGAWCLDDTILLLVQILEWWVGEGLCRKRLCFLSHVHNIILNLVF